MQGILNRFGSVPVSGKAAPRSSREAPLPIAVPGNAQDGGHEHMLMRACIGCWEKEGAVVLSNSAPPQPPTLEEGTLSFSIPDPKQDRPRTV